MADEKAKDHKSEAQAVADLPSDVVDHDAWDRVKVPKGSPDMRPGNRGVPSKALLEEYPQTHPGALSPGQYADEVAGPRDPDLDPDSDEAREHAEKHVAAKRRRRFGL